MTKSELRDYLLLKNKKDRTLSEEAFIRSMRKRFHISINSSCIRLAARDTCLLLLAGINQLDIPAHEKMLANDMADDLWIEPSLENIAKALGLARKYLPAFRFIDLIHEHLLVEDDSCRSH